MMSLYDTSLCPSLCVRRCVFVSLFIRRGLSTVVCPSCCVPLCVSVVVCPWLLSIIVMSALLFCPSWCVDGYVSVIVCPSCCIRGGVFVVVSVVSYPWWSVCCCVRRVTSATLCPSLCSRHGVSVSWGLDGSAQNKYIITYI